jgi:hypothetical protein
MYAVKGFWALWDNICVLLPLPCMLLRDFGPYGTIFMLLPYAVKGFWALCDNICVLLPCMLLSDSGP